MLTFSGSIVNVEFDKNGDDGKFCYRKFENGEIKFHDLKSRQPNILKGVIIGKKSWGLFLNEWTDGIVECNFTKEEILEQFYEKGIKIPEPFLKDFENTIHKKKVKKYDSEIERLKNKGVL